MALRTSLARAVPDAPGAPRAGAGAIARPAGAPALRASTVVRYLGAAPIVVRGAFTGQAYTFTGSRSVQPVDARDLAGLLRKGLFRKSG